MRAMRTMVVVATAGLALAGCNKGADSTAAPAGTATSAGTVAPAASSTPSAPAGFTPPTSISRADYGGRIERRFRKLDRNGDGKLETSELPQKRAQRLLRRLDKNGDGTVSATEWSDGTLARFDKQDANHDGNLTSDERGKGKGEGGKRRKGQGRSADRIDDEGDEVDNGM